jgi:hypothetical protein
MVYEQIQQQSAILAFNDIYRILAAMSVLMIPSFLLFRRASTPRPAGAVALH